VANVIDALVVTLGLDPSGFSKGQKAVSEGLAKTRDETDKSKKSIEGYGKSVNETFESMTRRAITFFAVLAGAKSIEEFTTKIISQDAALGRLAVTLGVLPQDLSAMTGAVERNGGSAEAAASSFKSLSDSFEDIKINGNSGILPMLYKLQGLTGVNIDRMHGFSAALPGIADALKALKDAGRDVDADYFARSLGLDAETAIALEQGWAKFHADIERYKRENPPDPTWVKQAQELTEGWNDAKKALQGFGRYFVETFSPLMRHEMRLLVDILHGDLTKMLGDYKKIFGDLIGYLTGALGAIGDLTNNFYHKLYGKWLFDPAAQGPGGPADNDDASGGPRLPGAGGTGLRSRRGEGVGNDAIRQRGSARIGKLAQSGNAKAVINELRSAGYNDNAIAAVVGSMQTESGLNPAVPENAYNRGHHGLWQWDSTRWSKISAWIRSRGGNPWDASWQAKAWIAEHNAKPGDAIYDGSSTAAGGAILRGNPTLPQAVHGVRLSERFGPGEEGGRAIKAANWLPLISKPDAPLVHIDPKPISIFGDLSGAAAAFHRTTNNNASTVTNSSSTNIGTVNVHTQATDGDGIAKSIKPALQRHSFAIQANHGPN
jgi:hypothetical protein